MSAVIAANGRSVGDYFAPAWRGERIKGMDGFAGKAPPAGEPRHDFQKKHPRLGAVTVAGVVAGAARAIASPRTQARRGLADAPKGASIQGASIQGAVSPPKPRSNPVHTAGATWRGWPRSRHRRIGGAG